MLSLMPVYAPSLPMDRNDGEAIKESIHLVSYNQRLDGGGHLESGNREIQ
jgi:hypothetical protein